MVQTVATDYDTVWDAGASGGNGQLAAALTLLSTELNGLAIAALALSSAGGSSGVFTNANTLQAILGVPFLILGGAVEVPATRPTVSLWFLESPDGSTFESPGRSTGALSGCHFPVHHAQLRLRRARHRAGTKLPPAGAQLQGPGAEQSWRRATPQHGDQDRPDGAARELSRSPHPSSEYRHGLPR